MYLVKAIVDLFQTADQSPMTEAEIKIHIGKARKDYGTTNNTLRRLCKHGVLRRFAGVSRTTGIPSWCYRLEMNSYEVSKYIIDREAAVERHKPNNPEAYWFGRDFQCTTNWSDVPFVIGQGLAPDNLANRCLIVNDKYQVEILPDRYRQILVFRPKK